MMTRKHRLTFLIGGVMTLASVATCALVEAKGKPGGGGGEDPPPATPPVIYDITWLPTPAGSSSSAEDVNLSETVVGYTLDTNSVWTAVVWPASGGVLDLNVELANLLNGERLTSVRNINNAGRMVGHADDAFGDKITFVYDETLAPPLQWLRLTGETRWVRDLTEGGTVLIELTNNGQKRAVVWEPGVGYTEVPEIVLDWVGGVRGLNDAGVIVGGTNYSAFSYELGAAAPIWLAGGGKESFALDINDNGVIAGEISSSAVDPVRWVNGVPTLLTELGNKENAGAASINEDGQIIGNVRTGTNRNNVDRPFIFDPVDGFWKIDELVDVNDPDAADWFLSGYIRVIEIGEAAAPLVVPYGCVVGVAILDTGTPYAFVLTPLAP